MRTLVSLVFFAFASSAMAVLVWDDATVTIDTQGSPETRTTEFRFRNASDRPVRIRGVKSSCGCTVVKPERDAYAPGERGVLSVAHKPKPGSVPRRYRITVNTDEAGGRSYDLSLIALSEPRLTVEGRRMLVWEKDEVRAPKEIKLRTKPGDSLRLTGAIAEGDLAKAELIGAGDSRILRVTPKEGAAGRLRIRLQSEPTLPEMDATFFAVLR